MQFGQLQYVVDREHTYLVSEVPAKLQVVPKPPGPVVLHVEQIGLVHRVNRQRRSHATSFIMTLSMAGHVSESASTRRSSRLIVEVIGVRYLCRVFTVGEARPLHLINLTIQLLLTPLQLLQLFETLSGSIVDDYFLIGKLLAFPGHHAATFASILVLPLHIHLLLLLLLLLLQLQFIFFT